MEDQSIMTQIAATIRQTMQEEFQKQRVLTKSLSDVWANEAEVLELCGKSRRTLLNAIAIGKIKPNDVRQNPLGKGYLFRRSAIVKD